MGMRQLELNKYAHRLHFIGIVISRQDDAMSRSDGRLYSRSIIQRHHIYYGSYQFIGATIFQACHLRQQNRVSKSRSSLAVSALHFADERADTRRRVYHSTSFGHY